PLFGKGFDALGQDHQPCDRPVPHPKADELLVRIDAIGLCFSDVKLIRAGEEHPRVVSKDLKSDPVIPGHEAVMTIVEAGAQLTDKFKPGSRYIIQADIYVKGVGFAYGYAINGGMAQYSILDQRVLNGDEGCYLLPLADQVPAAIAALIEPWTCVIASYRIEHRGEPLAGGSMLVAMEPGDATAYGWSGTPGANAPAKIDCLNVNPATQAALRQAFPKAVVTTLAAAPAGSYDDILLCGVRTRALGEPLAKLGTVNACVSFAGPVGTEPWSFDLGSIHYKGWFYQGTPGTDLAAAYGRNVRAALKKGGSCWLPGGAGAMGQMHTQLAVENPDGPGRILVTDLDNVRIEKMMQLLGPAAKARGIEFKAFNPKSFASDVEFMAAVRAFAPDGFDDIVMLVPVVPVATAAAPLLAKDGLMNIFAGIPAGKEGMLSVADIAAKGVRYIGSSGSKTADLRHTLNMVETGKLNPATALAAVGGMRALWEGIDGVANARFAGKTVIFPNCEEMPLTPVEQLPQLVPGTEKTLANGQYTQATEKLLLAKFETDAK
ncbi:MAG: alcohol dehydrogenase catalytic domain-containing protein, partial [Lentisphaeria bacterium]